MWTYNGENITSPNGYIAFVYEIKNIDNGRLYIGKKLFQFTRKRKKFESDWKTYTGSSKQLNADIAEGATIQKKMLRLCKSKGEASYFELKEQIDRNVLFDEQYYNQFIGCKIHARHLSIR